MEQQQPPPLSPPSGDLGVELQKMGGENQFSLDDAIEQVGFGSFQIKLILVVGLSWMADAMEMMVLSVLSPVLKCEWDLSSFEEALITTVVFLGQGVGSLSWGFVSDLYGRKKALYSSVFLVMFFGVLSSQAPDYKWILILRFLVGFGIGGVPQAAIILTEMLPIGRRGRAVVCLEFFWALGSVFAAVLAIAVIDELNWRYYLLVITIPILLFMLTVFWVPESPRFLFTTGKRVQLNNLIARMCASNGKPIPKGTLVQSEVNVPRGPVGDLFKKGWRQTTALLFTTWFTSAFCYYGIVLLTTEIFQTNISGCYPNGHAHPSNVTRSLGRCKKLTREDYTHFMVTSIAEFPGIFIALLLIDTLGRRKSLALQFLLASITFLSLAICTNRTVSVIFLFVVRCLITGSFQTVYVYTAEVLPTNIRAVGMGSCSMFARIGAMLTPFVAQVLIYQSFYWVVAAYFAPLLICVVASLLLKVETAGKSLADTSKSNTDYQSLK